MESGRELRHRFARIVLGEAMQAATKATAHGGQVHKNNAELMESNASFFFENHDNERYDFYRNLLADGFATKHYMAPYHWSVEKKVDGITGTVLYVEGDVYIRIQ